MATNNQTSPLSWTFCKENPLRLTQERSLELKERRLSRNTTKNDSLATFYHNFINVSMFTQNNTHFMRIVEHFHENWCPAVLSGVRELYSILFDLCYYFSILKTQQQKNRRLHVLSTHKTPLKSIRTIINSINTNQKEIKYTYFLRVFLLLLLLLLLKAPKPYNYFWLHFLFFFP